MTLYSHLTRLSFYTRNISKQVKKPLAYVNCCSNILTKQLSTSTTTNGNSINNNIETYDAFSSLIPLEEHKSRQSRLVNLVCKKLHSNSTHLFSQNTNDVKAALIIPSSVKCFQADTNIPLIHFKQNSDFIYLTGLSGVETAGSVLILLIDEDKYKSLLFVPFQTDHELAWEGPGIHSPLYQEKLKVLADAIENAKYVDSFIVDESSKRRIFVTKAGLPKKIQLNNEPEQLSPLIDELRVIKSTSEFLAMKRTCSIGSNALKNTMNFTGSLVNTNKNLHNLPGLVNESQIAGKFEYECKLRGAVKPAYPSVVAGSSRSTIIHYGSSNRFVKPDDWLLMDAGCEDVDGYNSDITRCWIINGSSPSIDSSASQSRLQSALFEALCEVHETLIQQTVNYSSEKLSLDHLFTLMCALLGRVLIEFGVIPKSSSTSDAARSAYKVCPHHVSHYLGLDVHDCPSISRSLPLVPGMCFTVEPGLYFSERNGDLKKEFKGIGLRVEDDLIIQPNTGQVTVLTKSCPYTPNSTQ